MVTPVTRFSPLPPTVDESGPRGRAPLVSPTHSSLSGEPAEKPAGSALLVVAGAMIGLTLFAAATIVASGKPPLECQLIELVNHLFPIGPRREWLLTGFPRYTYLPHIPSLPPDLAYLTTGATPMTQQGIAAVGAAWYRALEHRYGNTISFVLAARNPDLRDELISDIGKDQKNLRNLIALYGRLKTDGVVFSERQAIDLEEAAEVLDSIL